MIEMAAWMAVLSLRAQAIHRNADRARVETETMRALAQTDALTGLPNRRGPCSSIWPRRCRAPRRRCWPSTCWTWTASSPSTTATATTWATRCWWPSASGCRRSCAAATWWHAWAATNSWCWPPAWPTRAPRSGVGQKLLAAFDSPFDAAGQRCSVGLTAGYALAPLDGTTADELIKRTDAAMYAGKQAGRRQVQRGGRSLVMA